MQRFTTFALFVLATPVLIGLAFFHLWLIPVAAVVAALAALGVWDRFPRAHRRARLHAAL